MIEDNRPWSIQAYTDPIDHNKIRIDISEDLVNFYLTHVDADGWFVSNKDLTDYVPCYSGNQWASGSGYVLLEIVEGAAPPPPPDYPTLEHEIKYLGEGEYGVTFTVFGNDGKQSSFFTNMTFEGVNGGQIQQVQGQIDGQDPEPVDIDDDVTATVYDLLDPDYDMDYDSYFLTPFGTGDVMNITQADNYYHIEAGTGGGGAYEHADLAYIVTTGDVSYDGVISRLAVNYDAIGIAEMPPPGDANLDDQVDGADYTIWADNYLVTDVGWEGGDFNGDGEVDGADYTIWADHYGVGGSAVPEPATLALLAVAGLATLRRRR